MTFTNGSHSYYGRFNDRAKRSRSKIVKGIKKIATPRTFRYITWERKCPGFTPNWKSNSPFICDNCKNFKNLTCLKKLKI